MPVYVTRRSKAKKSPTLIYAKVPSQKHLKQNLIRLVKKKVLTSATSSWSTSKRLLFTVIFDPSCRDMVVGIPESLNNTKHLIIKAKRGGRPAQTKDLATAQHCKKRHAALCRKWLKKSQKQVFLCCARFRMAFMPCTLRWPRLHFQNAQTPGKRNSQTS